MAKAWGEKISWLCMQGSGKCPSPAPPKKLSVPGFPAGTTQCRQQDVLSSRITAAQYKQQLNG